MVKLWARKIKSCLYKPERLCKLKFFETDLVGTLVNSTKTYSPDVREAIPTIGLPEMKLRVGDDHDAIT